MSCLTHRSCVACDIVLVICHLTVYLLKQTLLSVKALGKSSESRFDLY